MSSSTRSYLELHISVILWGFTAVLGKLIQLPAVDLVWWRCLITLVSLFFLIRPISRVWNVDKKAALQFFVIGLIFGFHWLTFFGSIKISTPTITLLCLSTCAFFSSIFEPLITGSRYQKHNSFVAILIVPAMYFIFQSVDVSYHKGIWVGLLSSVLAAIVVCLNKKIVSKLDPLNITFYEIGGCFAVMSALKLFGSAEKEILIPDAQDFCLLIFLALACTTLTWILVLRALKAISAFSVSLAVNLEAVYGIILAAVLLQDYENLNRDFYIGATMIILIVFSYPFLNRMKAE